MDVSTAEVDRQALIKRLKSLVTVPMTGDETAAVRSVKAQYKEKTNVDLRDEVALEWVREARAANN
ncbi:hypothetical protein [Mycolicibacterium thermoresistibile]|uniref:Uncharacterized protein n=1 Tax=Mycolicibacterium thermoresistibile (strain ATCC 19527 / DSM 44167 / CIP 105390 / JCM 6362 / NCTC 10409 / 316) TaxID=1078020 RepID=G7CKK0_MYCT3|nr:hypothetical protein [Mycolicibacterium thermoresistibile]EHI11710.1 hypothetical protein KEK_12463 [Mycolicibacterium thermoresistibile ATCC 19527]MCV7187863.1 hypothetical protein [Mycolicibacterium thermoresistibile]SNW17033.1 Uncharacterised protein [Mycolicibacterium thermoresistibile]